MQCKQSGCEEAVAIVHWPGKQTEQCMEHCKQLNGLSNIMGTGKLLFTSLQTGQTMEFN